MTPDEYTSRDATALAALVHRGEVTPRECLQTALAITAQLNPRLNAVVHLFADRAAQQLEQLKIWRGPDAPPFAGVPFLFKDMLDWKDTPVSYGSTLLRSNRSHRTHALIARVLATGVLPFGRTNMSELGLLPTTEPACFGPTDNPWKSGYSPGGSSGGSAAAVAARLVPMAYGSDGGGSIRIPASACGVFGLKPSRGRHPAETDDDPDAFVAHHVLTRSVRDSARMLDATAGSRPVDRWHLSPPPVPFAAALEKDPPRLRIAFTVTDGRGRRADRDCCNAVEHTVQQLSDLGHVIEEAAPTIDGNAFAHAFVVLWSMSVGYFFRAVRRELQGDNAPLPNWARRLLQNPRFFDAAVAMPLPGGALVEPFTRRLARFEGAHSPSDLWMAWTVMRKAEVAVLEFLRRYDLWVTPVLGETPWPQKHIDFGRDLRVLEERVFQYAAYTPIANAGGLPAMSVPLHWNAEGVPIGTHVLGPLGSEWRLLQVAAQLERACPWNHRRPPLDV